MEGFVFEIVLLDKIDKYTEIKSTIWCLNIIITIGQAY